MAAAKQAARKVTIVAGPGAAVQLENLLSQAEHEDEWEQYYWSSASSAGPNWKIHLAARAIVFWCRTPAAVSFSGPPSINSIAAYVSGIEPASFLGFTINRRTDSWRQIVSAVVVSAPDDVVVNLHWSHLRFMLMNYSTVEQQKIATLVAQQLGVSYEH